MVCGLQDCLEQGVKGAGRQRTEYVGLAFEQEEFGIYGPGTKQAALYIKQESDVLRLNGFLY